MNIYTRNNSNIPINGRTGAVQCQWRQARMRPAEADGDATTVLHVRRGYRLFGVRGAALFRHLAYPVAHMPYMFLLVVCRQLI